MKNLLFRLTLVFLTLNFFTQCSENNSTLAGGASETEAGFQVSVLNAEDKPASLAKVWIHDRSLVSEAIDSTFCDAHGICNFDPLPPGSYLVRSEFEQLMSMEELFITASQDSVPLTVLQLSLPSQIEIKSFDINSDDSLVRIGITGFGGWDTVRVDQSWESSLIPVGDHTLIIESTSEPILLTAPVSEEKLVITTTSEAEAPPVHYQLDDFTDQLKQSDWSFAEGLTEDTWQFQGELDLKGSSDALVKTEDNSISTFLKMSETDVIWGDVPDYYWTIDTANVGGVAIMAKLDSTLLPDNKPYLDLVTSFYSTQAHPFTQIDSVSLMLITEGAADFQMVAFNSKQEVIDSTERVGTATVWEWTTLHFNQINFQTRQVGLRLYGKSTAFTLIIVHGR